MEVRRGWVALWGMLLVSSAATSATASGWLRDVDHALSVAQTEQRPLVVFVSMDGCVHCYRMIQTTFRDTGIRRTLGSSFVAAAIKGSERPDLMQQLKIRSYPTTLLVSPDGQVLDQMVGYVAAEKLQARLDRVAAGRQAAAAQTPAADGRGARR
jgi:thioredoxin-related protein